MMQIFRAKIALDSHRTEETIFGLEHGYSLTLNRKNKAMVSVDKIYCELTDNLVVNDHMIQVKNILKVRRQGQKDRLVPRI